MQPTLSSMSIPELKNMRRYIQAQIELLDEQDNQIVYLIGRREAEEFSEKFQIMLTQKFHA